MRSAHYSYYPLYQLTFSFLCSYVHTLATSLPFVTGYIQPISCNRRARITVVQRFHRMQFQPTRPCVSATCIDYSASGGECCNIRDQNRPAEVSAIIVTAYWLCDMDGCLYAEICVVRTINGSISIHCFNAVCTHDTCYFICPLSEGQHQLVPFCIPKKSSTH